MNNKVNSISQNILKLTKRFITNHNKRNRKYKMFFFKRDKFFFSIIEIRIAMNFSNEYIPYVRKNKKKSLKTKQNKMGFNLTNSI